MLAQELRSKFLEFFKSRGHAIVPSSSLLPDDPSVLLTTAGMQQFKKYYTREADPVKDFGSENTVSIQKSFRTSDIDEVGDDSHLTFFQMLGNFSFGGYFKKEAIEYAYEFISKELGLKIDFVSVFKGDLSTSSGQAPADVESEKIWKSLDKNLDIRKFGREDNFWGPTGSEGPCGPTTEIYVDGVEIWNIVFNEYYKKPTGAYEKLKTPGIDTGMGLERLAMVAQGKKNIFETDLFSPLANSLGGELPEKTKRIIADHSRASFFLMADGVRPSNKEAGYILRRIMRRVFVYMYLNKMRPDTFEELAKIVISNYGEFYRELEKTRVGSINAMWEEYEKFGKSLGQGIRELEKISSIDASFAFRLYESFGLPYEIIKELGGKRAIGLSREAFHEEFRKHQEISRAGQEKKFGGHGLLLDTGELKAKDEEELKKVTRLHTATHLLQAALRKVLGNEVGQMGSDITAERTRFDFSFPRKLTPEEIKKVEESVNKAIADGLEVKMVEMNIEEAKKSGALYFFKEKYPKTVKVYSAGDFSKELCGGPHVKNTRDIGKFAILKEEAVASGVRRIRAIVSP